MLQWDEAPKPKAPDVTILIVNYNVKDYLLQCLRSIVASGKEASTEIIVVDNASADDSVKDLQPQFPHVKWIALKENVGFGRGNNVGLEHATGRYVLFLNPDTLLGKDSIATMVRYLDTHPEVGLAGCKVLNPDGTFQLACRRGLPTPWASFCRLFGLQKLFPGVKIFAGYNLTYRSIDETYNVDGLIGAFMIGPLSVVTGVGGFDPEFFMYGEDLDLCYRIQKTGKAIRYVHTTTIVHFKGESTKRSAIDEVQVFYDAMRIFANKHFGRSTLFLDLLRLGIGTRSLMERVYRRKREWLTAIADLVSINAALMWATDIRFSGPFGFPDYAYPTVFIVVTAIALLSFISVGEYVEYKPTMRRSLVGLLVTFFMLSSLTYFFKEYAFSRGVLLMTIGFSAVALSAIRGATALFDATRGTQKRRRIIVVGLTDNARRIITSLQTAEFRHAEIVGVVSSEHYRNDHFEGYRVLGTIEYLEKIVREHQVLEVIVADLNVSQAEVMDLMIRCSSTKTRFHLASEYDDIVMARIINDVAGIEPTVPISPLHRFRNRIVKRLIDIVVALCVVPFVAIRLVLDRRGYGERGRIWVSVLHGTRSLVGLYPDQHRRNAGKEGITGLVHISQQKGISQQAIEHLNDYYVDHYTLSLDVEILLKHLLRRRGNHSNS